MSAPQGTPREAGSVRVIIADAEPGAARPRRGLPRGTRFVSIMLAALLASAGVIIGVRLARAAPPPPAQTPSTSLDARSAPTLDATRLVLVGPRVLADTRKAAAPTAGGTVDLPVDDVPQDATALALEVSIIKSAGPGAVTIRSTTVLRVPKANVTTSATAIIPIGQDRRLIIETEGGGHLLVNLVGAFVPAESATAGRVVATPPIEVLRLVPRSSGKDAKIEMSRVPALREAGSYAAVLFRSRPTSAATVAASPSGLARAS